jgi:hypothetical protein
MKKNNLTPLGLRAVVCVFMLLFSLSSLFAQQGYVTIGSGTGTTGGAGNNASSVSPITPGYRNFRYQVIYTKAEIEAAGGIAGNINRLAWNIATSTTGLTNYTVSLGHTTASSFSAHITGATQVYTASAYSPSTGLNDLIFSTPFNWNGTNNIVVEVCYSRSSTSATGGSVYTTTGTSPTNRYVSNSSATPTLCATNTGTNNFSTKPQVRFYMTVPATCVVPTNLANTAVTGTSASFSWTNGSPTVGVAYAVTTTNVAPTGTGTNATGTSVTVNTGLTSGTSYYFWMRNRCTSTTNSDWISVPFTTACTAPTISNLAASTGCTPTLSAATSAGTIYWWNAATGGSLLGTGTSYTPSASGTYYASAGQAMSGSNLAQLGAGASTSTLASQSPFYANSTYRGQSTNYLIKASELLAAGIGAGYITSLSLDVVVAGGALNTFYIKADMTNEDNLSNGFVSTSSYRYGGGINGVTYQPTVGINTFEFSSGGMYWDGTSNISIVIYHQTASSSAATTVKFDNNVGTDINRSQWLSSSSSWSTAASTHSRPKLLINGKGLCMSNRSSIVATIGSGDTVFYRDADGDGFGDPNVTITSCTAPNGYVTNSLDCDDTKVMYQDLDGDGFGSNIKVACDGVLNNSDCNDTLVMYADLDGDGFGSTIKVACNGVINSLDCDDTKVMYQDLDGDGFGSAIKVACGGVLGNTDCDDTKITYADADGDGFAGATMVPCGAFLVAEDCDDTNNAIYPGATEICYDGIIQNCGTDGKGGCPVILTTLHVNSCGKFLTSLNTPVYAAIPAIPSGTSITGYKFEITNVNTGAVRELERTINYFTMSMTDIFEYVSTYSIRVSVRINQEWQPYGSSCSVTTLALPTTAVVSATCGTTLIGMASQINSTPVSSVDLYEFRVVNAFNPSEVQTVQLSNYRFNLTMLTQYPVQYATTYNISVRVRSIIDGTEVWSNYGTECSVTTPVSPTAQIQLSQCEMTATGWSQSIGANTVGAATEYKFILRNAALSYEQEVIRTGRIFTLSLFTGLQSGTTYDVTVSVKTYGQWSPEGKACSITTPGVAPVAVRDAVVAKKIETTTDFKLIGYPNPFTTSFGIELRSTSTESLSLSVYDITGRLLEVLEVSVDEVSSVQLGERYPAGIYNVVAAQGDTTTVIRLIKR